MFFKPVTKKSTDACSPPVKELAACLSGADAVVIGAGAGLSASAGFDYAGTRFQQNFSDFIREYGFTDMYSAGFYPFATPEEYWAYWSRYILLNRYMPMPKPVYETLLSLVWDKDYFVLTTNVDHCFQKAGFDRQRLFYTQGDYGLWQCSIPCDAKTYGNEETVRRMAKEQINRRVPSELIPHCPVCGAPMRMNLRMDDTFVEDAGWQAAAKRYRDFIQRHSGQAVLYWELGVGWNTPGIIKYPFWKLTRQNKNAVYGCVNQSETLVPREIKNQSICIRDDIGKVLEQIKKF